MFFFLIPASVAETAAVIPNGAKIFFAKGIATFINGSATLLSEKFFRLNYFTNLCSKMFCIS